MKEFFGDLSGFQIALGFGQVLVLAVLVATLFLTWRNLRLIGTRMRLETRPILQVDLRDYRSATPSHGFTPVIASDELDQWRGQDAEAGYRYLQCLFSNRQSNPAGTSLGAEITFRLIFPAATGQAMEVAFVHHLPILEALERDNGPLWIAEVGALPWCSLRIESAKYSDVDANTYQRVHGTIGVGLQQGQPPDYRYGQLGV